MLFWVSRLRVVLGRRVAHKQYTSDIFKCYDKYYVFGQYPSSRPFFKKHIVSETGFCLRPQVKPTQLDPIIYHRHKRLNLISKCYDFNLKSEI
jgi:hypothetical protein